MNNQNTGRFLRWFCRISIVLTICAFVVACWMGSQDMGLINGDFGPGSYYYSDIPGWEKIFLSESTWHLGFGNPIAAMAFFVIWGLVSFKALLWLDKKIK